MSLEKLSFDRRFPPRDTIFIFHFQLFCDDREELESENFQKITPESIFSDTCGDEVMIFNDYNTNKFKQFIMACLI